MAPAFVINGELPAGKSGPASNVGRLASVYSEVQTSRIDHSLPLPSVLKGSFKIVDGPPSSAAGNPGNGSCSLLLMQMSDQCNYCSLLNNASVLLEGRRRRWAIYGKFANAFASSPWEVSGFSFISCSKKAESFEKFLIFSLSLAAKKWETLVRCPFDSQKGFWYLI